MKLPNFVRIFRGETKEKVFEDDDWSKYPSPYEILTEHERVHFIKYKGEVVEYMPLTMAEEFEQEYLANDDALSPLYYMLAKAIAKRVKDGLFHIDALADEPSVVSYVKRTLNEDLPLPAVHDIYTSIQKDRTHKMNMVEALFTKYSEPILEESKHRPAPRQDTPLDIHVGNCNMFSKNISPMGIGAMTRLQLTYINRISSQSGIRAMNDHDFAMKQRH